MQTQRIETLRSKLGAHGLDYLLITSPENIFYLSGFTGSFAAILLGESLSIFITDFRYLGRAATAIADLPYELCDSQLRPLPEVVGGLLPGGGSTRLGLESASMNQHQYSQFAALQGITAVPSVKLVELQRMIKDAHEVELIQRAVQLGERIFTETIATIRADTIELDLALEIEFRARRHGAEGISFSPIVASGDNSSMPHAGHSKRQLVRAAPLTIDMGVRLGNYCSDMTRTVFIGECPGIWREIYGIVREAKELAAASIRPGQRGCDIDKVARDYIAAHGHAAHFGHGLGHGVGIQLHEDPRLLGSYEGVLTAGNVTSLEPGIYLPGQGGVRIEDMILVTESGHLNFNSLTTELQVLG
jgi:Xaa-Pro aminopeptidase